MAKEKEEKKDFLRNKETLNIKDFMLLKSGEQDKLLEETLNKVYDGKVKFTKKHIDKVLNVAFDNKDNEVYLPHSLCVKKDGNKLIFSFKKNNKLLIVLFLLGFLFLTGFATATGIKLIGATYMNIDIDGDGYADLNIDTNNDGICEVNCTTNINARVPEYNIAHGKSKTPMFNVKMKDENGNEYIFNPMNQLDENGVCYLNCDVDGDGWPDTNIDLDGDGKADINIDIDGNGTPDLNVDTNDDGVADINIDEDGDGVCDKKCSYVVSKGGQATIGGGSASVDIAALVVTFETGSDVKVTDLYPDDQPDDNVNKTVNDIIFTVENKTSQSLYYDLSWLEVINDFETTNFWTKIKCDGGGYDTGDWVTAPKASGTIKSNIEIPANTVQKYTVSFTLHGIGQEQNIDQGKTFKGRIEVNLKEV